MQGTGIRVRALARGSRYYTQGLLCMLFACRHIPVRQRFIRCGSETHTRDMGPPPG